MHKNRFKLTFLSLAALMLLIVSLAGSTWAWYSNNIQSAKNEITLGKLDLSLNMSTQNQKQQLDERMNFSFDEFEEGKVCVIELENSGTLPLAYETQINVLGIQETMLEKIGLYYQIVQEKPEDLTTLSQESWQKGERANTLAGELKEGSHYLLIALSNQESDKQAYKAIGQRIEILVHAEQQNN